MVLLWRGFAGYRAAIRLGDTSTSRIATLAAGEVRITGTVEPAEVMLVSPLQSAPCVWYRARITATGEGDGEAFAEERGVGFRVRDGTGTIRVFPRGAAFDVPAMFADETDGFGEPPPGLVLRTGSAYGAVGPEDREAAIAALLTVRAPEGGFRSSRAGALGLSRRGRRRYEEARLETGAAVTVVGSAVPFGHLDDAEGADHLDRYGDPLAGLEDPEVAASIARARAAGELLTPEEAWGNAAIPGFGIGRPVRAPELDPDADRPPLATPVEAAHTARTFDLEPDLLVLAAGPDTPLLVALGSPAQAVGRQQGRFLVGLLGALLAIGSAVVLALTLPGALGG